MGPPQPGHPDLPSRRAERRLVKAQSSDGLWRTPYLAGPGHTALGLIATATWGPSQSVPEDLELATWLCRVQGADGAWEAFPGGPPSTGASRLCAAALQAVERRHGRALQARLSAAVARAEVFCRGHRADDPFWALLADGPLGPAGWARWAEPANGPLVVAGSWAFLTAPLAHRLRHRVSSFTLEVLPALAVLTALPPGGIRRAPWVGGALRALEGPGLSFLARHVESLQNPNGSWLWSVFGTVLNLAALVRAGRDPASAPVQRGIAFIRGLRARDSAGALRQSWCNAELWDTAMAGGLLLDQGHPPADFAGQRIAEVFLQELRPGGLWAFGAGARQGDHDSAAMAASFVFRLAAKLDGHPDTAARARAAAGTVARTLLAAQQKDGGWGFSPGGFRAPFGWGRRVPFGLETAAIDGSTADVTGRVLSALAAAEAAGELSACAPALAEARQRAVAFLRGSQAGCGSWFGRWSPGYLLAGYYVAPVLRTLGAADLLARLRAFLLAHQNPDGGFGETVASDRDPHQAGIGPSTTLHTSFAVVGLIATTPEGGGDSPGALARAVRFLEGAAGAEAPMSASYTVAFREDYYDAPRMTDASVLSALAYARRAQQAGAEIATRERVTGVGEAR